MNVYTKISQNELAMQFFKMGFFNPQATDQALMCLDLMEFDGKDTVMQKVAQNGTMYQKMVQYMQLALTLAAKAAPDMVAGLSQDIMQTMGTSGMAGSGASAQQLQADHIEGLPGGESTMVQNAREKSNAAAQPDGGAVVKERKK